MTKLPPSIAAALAPFMPPVESKDECEHSWRIENDSFDHAFGVRRLPSYKQCRYCDTTAEITDDD